MAGAALALLVLGALAAAGLIGVRDPDVAELSARLARLETSQAAPAKSTAVVNDLSARLSKAETALAAPRPTGTDPAVSERLAAVEAANKAIAAKLDDLSQRVDATGKALDDITQAAADHVQQPGPDKSAVDGLGERVAALESKLNNSTPNAAADRAVRLAVLAAALKSAAERGSPFASELAAVRSLVPDAKLLAPLQPFAATGLPTAAALGTELSGLIPAISRTAEVPVSGGFLDRLQSSANRLVRIRPLDEPQSDDPADVLTRVEIRAARADIAGALNELAKLPAPVRAPASAWIAKAEARATALAAADRLADAALDTLGKPQP